LLSKNKEKTYYISIYIKKYFMAKGKSVGESRKITFGKKSGKGKARKSFGPKDQKPKKYRGQGRS
jgi:hypothetical protein